MLLTDLDCLPDNWRDHDGADASGQAIARELPNVTDR
jgi:hypothetical protein